ncbi:MAG: hypothetical protein H6817_12135 [Phycisphaerales bacterium]|nr:hypothetical protein [Phycisphaerales bacterium]
MDSRAQPQRAWLQAPPRERRIARISTLFEEQAVARALGYGPRSGREIPHHVASAVLDVRRQAQTLVDPKSCWLAVSAEVTRDELKLCEPYSCTLGVGNLVAAQMRGCDVAVFFVVTIGDELERVSREMMADGDALEGYILDALGSVAVEACAERLADEVLREVMPLGWQVTNRFSPGYCTWATSEQRLLFDVLGGSPAGVSLTPSGLMHPLKSISGVIGVGASAKFHPYPCAFCGREDCHQRLVDASVTTLG